MSVKKKITVGFYQIETRNNEYLTELTKLLKGSPKCVLKGNFETKYDKYVYAMADTVALSDDVENVAYLFALSREKSMYPVQAYDSGDITELVIDSCSVGDVAYCLLLPESGAILTIGASSGFKRLLENILLGDLRLRPYFINNIDEKVLKWDCYKRVSFGLSMPSGEDVVEFQDSRAGELVTILGYLGGLKAEINISAGNGNELLSNMMVKDLLPELLTSDRCKSLTVRGSDFDGTPIEQYDLKNAQYKYHETVEIEGKYLPVPEVKQSFLRALGFYGGELGLLY